MLSKEQAKEICLKERLQDVEMLEVIQYYIYEKKGVDPGTIQRPRTLMQISLMNKAFNSAMNYYLEAVPAQEGI